MYLAIRVKGNVGTTKKEKDRLKALGLNKKHSFALVPENSIGLLKKANNYITWGEASPEIQEKLNTVKKGLNPPKKGFEDTKRFYPRGAMGYRGEKINELAERMMNGATKKA